MPTLIEHTASVATLNYLLYEDDLKSICKYHHGLGLPETERNNLATLHLLESAPIDVSMARLLVEFWYDNNPQ